MSQLLLFDTVKSAPPDAGPLPDEYERKQALDIHQSWIVEAPAGSGKTGLLIQRYLKLLGDESVTSPGQVLAITFTKKAAAEMRERVLAQLQAALPGVDPARDFDRETRPFAEAALARDRALNWQLLDQPHRLNIRTIDSVCSEIANSLPVLSGSGGGRNLADDASPLYAAAAHRTFMQLGGNDPTLNQALRDVLLHRDGNLADCENMLAAMLSLRDQWGELVPLGRRELDDAYLDSTILPRLERALEQATSAALTQLEDAFPPTLLDQLTDTAAELARLEGYKGNPSPIAICAGNTRPPNDRGGELAHWRGLIHLLITKEVTWRKSFKRNHMGFELGRSERTRLESLVQRFEGCDDLLEAIRGLNALPPATYPREQWHVAKALFRVLNRAMAELQIVFAERSECDYAEVALAAKAALNSQDGPHDLEAALGMRLQHILIDEMQDTSTSQYQLIQMLTADFDGHSQTAFLVGDPKQSIYLFRQARVERFLRTIETEQLGELPVGHLQLTANFRSQANLVTRFNEDFSQIFPGEFVGATARHPANDDMAGRRWHATVLPYTPTGEESKEKKRQQLKSALEIRKIIADRRSRPLPEGRNNPWTVAILVRSRNDLERIVATLKDESFGPPIPFRAVDIDPLGDRPEVRDLFALTRALLHPADRTAWLAVLHAPWCGFGLPELHTLTGADDPAFAQTTIQSLIEARGELLPVDAAQRLERIWLILKAASALRSRAPLAQIVERTWRSLGGDAYCNPSELANARRYLQLLDEVEAQRAVFDPATLEARLEKLYAAPSVDPNAIDIMTIHKAKGLEWDVVIVPALHRKSGSNRSQLLSWVELDSTDEDSAHFLLAPIQGKGEDSHQLNKWIRSIHDAREAAERKRLFYVACTRAREELHLFAAPALTSTGELEPKAGTLLKAAWPAAEPFFVGASASLPVEEQPDEALDIAASATPPEDAAARRETPSERPAVLKRLPFAFDPSARFINPRPLPYGTRDVAPTAAPFERPEGSVAARAFGNAVHAFLERIARQIAAGDSAAAIHTALPTWMPRIAALLRSEGLQPAMVDRLAQRVLRGLDATLKDQTGLWLLSPHQDAASEFALTAWSKQRSNIRVDRIFRAGPVPLAAGSDHLWIVDYKTTDHGSQGLDAFLAQERAKYAPQLEAYAAVLGQAEGEPAIRLALYFPMLSKLSWWTPKPMVPLESDAGRLQSSKR